jgi:hypothetical protein
VKVKRGIGLCPRHISSMHRDACRVCNPKPSAKQRVKDVCDRITQYLSVGGLFNPELMEHQKVRDLLIDARSVLSEVSNGS